MKRFLLISCLLSILFFSYQAAGGSCSSKGASSSSRRSGGRIVRGTSKSISQVRLKALRKKERYLLNEIHRLQYYLYQREHKLSDKRLARYTAQLEKRITEFRISTSGILDFPFESRLRDFSTLVGDIQSGKVKFENCTGQKVSYIIRKIQQAQYRCLQKSYQYRF